MDQALQDIPGFYPACAVTHSMAKKARKQPSSVSDDQAIDQLGENCSAPNHGVVIGMMVI